MIGNDIVDLNLAKTQSNWQRKGFLEKQFTQQEQDEIWQSENPFLKVWLFWSMKEAAYKCIVQKHQKRFFNPKKLECFLISENEGNVVFENEFYYTKSTIFDNYIHTIASKEKGVNFASDLFLVNENSQQSNITNYKLLSFFGNETQLQKNKIGVPSLYKNNEKLAVSFSTSHHGNYGGLVILQ